jgi:NarL family two-component system response regulator LiaR
VSTANAIRVLIVDDHAVVRQGLRAFLQLQPDIDVVGEAASGNEAVDVAAANAPDVVLMDLVMPDGDGISAIRALGAACPEARVVVLSSYIDDAQVLNAIQAGAAGYLLKDIQPDDLAAAIRQVHRGLPALNPRAAALLMHRTGTRPQGAELTPRELDVLRLIAEGFANRDIATRLFVSEKTVKTHVSHILAKLEVADRTQAALLAVRNHMVD